MDRDGQPIDRVNDRMDNVGSEWHGVSFAKGLCASGFNSVRRAWNASPEDIVLSARVNTNHGPHAMIVRHHHHAWCPHYIEDRKRIRMEELTDFSALRFAEPSEDSGWLGHRACKDLTNCLVSRVRRESCAAVGRKLVHLKHRGLP